MKEIISKGIPSKKIIVGKPATQADAYNTGYMNPSDIGIAAVKAYNDFKWYGGIMFWQYSSDHSGNIIYSAASKLKGLC